jgi:ribosomal protein L32
MKTSIGKREQNRYLQNKEAKTGEIIKCPICGEVFIKKQYSQAFCCKECKGYYWNAVKPDRHKDKNYHHNYNQSHPERLDRGFTKGYNNGNVSDGPERKRKGGYVFDNLGRAYSLDPWNPTMTQMLNERLSMWHDDDWEESCWDD